MALNEEHNIIFTAADILDYHAGRLTPERMHAMEKAALDDPFLADAMEGLEENPIAPHQPQFDLLRQELATRINKEKQRRVIPLWLKIAATVMPLALIGGAIYLNSNRVETQLNSSVATHETPPAKINSIAVDSITTLDSNSLALVDQVPPNVNMRGKSKNNALPKQSAAQFSRIADSQPGVSAAPPEPSIPTQAEKAEDLAVMRRKNAESESHEQKTISADIAKTATQDKPASGIAAAANSLPSVVSGLVVDKYNRPIEGAAISIPSQQKGMMTGADGRFTMPLTDSVTKLEIASIGYETATVALRKGLPLNRIVLNENKDALNEVVVTGYGSRKISTAKKTADSNEVRPLVSWEAYYHYLDSHKNEAAIVNAAGDEVELSFDVDEKNQLTNIRIEKSDDPRLSAEAIRLVKEGPKWQTTRHRKTRTKLVIKF